MNLVKYDDKVLVSKAELVTEFDESLVKTLSEMAELMYSKQGVGLAAPQVNINKRMLVADLGYVQEQEYGSQLIKMVNPEVVSFSEEVSSAEEGCLSFPGLAVKVERPLAIRVRYQDQHGETKDESFSGWTARILMHEIDHLDGTTLYTRASSFSRKNFAKKFKK